MHCRIGPAVRPECFGTAGKTETIERRIEQLAGHVAGKRAAGAVGALLARAETDHQQLAIQRSESGNRPRMPVGVAAADGRQVFGEADARRAVARVVK